MSEAGEIFTSLSQVKTKPRQPIYFKGSMDGPGFNRED